MRFSSNRPKSRPQRARRHIGRCRLALTRQPPYRAERAGPQDRKSTRLNSSHLVISYAVFCLKKKKKHITIIQVIPFITSKISSKTPRPQRLLPLLPEPSFPTRSSKTPPPLTTPPPRSTSTILP